MIWRKFVSSHQTFLLWRNETFLHCFPLLNFSFPLPLPKACVCLWELDECAQVKQQQKFFNMRLNFRALLWKSFFFVTFIRWKSLLVACVKVANEKKAENSELFGSPVPEECCTWHHRECINWMENTLTWGARRRRELANYLRSFLRVGGRTNALTSYKKVFPLKSFSLTTRTSKKRICMNEQ